MWYLESYQWDMSAVAGCPRQRREKPELAAFAKEECARLKPVMEEYNNKLSEDNDRVHKLSACLRAVAKYGKDWRSKSSAWKRNPEIIL